mgnify:CR=1 FL=1|jgi:hypothetical protein|tara:strand:+ start:108 stop:851 length:744 start_codon:yes stop_codon:yes gene_type:complete
MAVSVNNVYQKVLAIANKEQRGYITPQEFNLFANQAQMDIFEQYFYDLNQFSRVPGNDTAHADVVALLNEKIDHFEKYRAAVDMSNGSGVGILPDYYRMGKVFYYDTNSKYVEIEKINQNDIHHIQNSPLTSPSVTRPVYVRFSSAGDNQSNRERRIQIYPTSITSRVQCNYIAKPATVKWTYTVSDTYKALYNDGASDKQDFELHASEENNLIMKILALAGISTKDAILYQAASAEEQKNIQQEKQ